ncbi:hypothetical protein B0H12DRAFT_1072926 [Mycena haematopus]|nr:hypothetical protein B0H12DRAFT_1072926 [Mycena haematopus]
MDEGKELCRTSAEGNAGGCERLERICTVAFHSWSKTDPKITGSNVGQYNPVCDINQRLDQSRRCRRQKPCRPSSAIAASAGRRPSAASHLLDFRLVVYLMEQQLSSITLTQSVLLTPRQTENGAELLPRSTTTITSVKPEIKSAPPKKERKKTQRFYKEFDIETLRPPIKPRIRNDWQIRNKKTVGNARSVLVKLKVPHCRRELAFENQLRLNTKNCTRCYRSHPFLLSFLSIPPVALKNRKQVNY